MGSTSLLTHLPCIKVPVVPKCGLFYLCSAVGYPKHSAALSRDPSDEHGFNIALVRTLGMCWKHGGERVLSRTKNHSSCILILVTEKILPGCLVQSHFLLLNRETTEAQRGSTLLTSYN